jgi:hypothetical protein
MAVHRGSGKLSCGVCKFTYLIVVKVNMTSIDCCDELFNYIATDCTKSDSE